MRPKLPLCHAEERESLFQPVLRKAFRQTIYLLSALALSFILIFFAWARVIPDLTLSSCGNTPTSARERGCLFDLISFTWQVPECYDASLVSAFASWDEWVFYTEAGGNVTVPKEVALRGERDLWVSWKYHIVHCTFTWRQMHRAYERGWIDTHLRAYNHTLHCQDMILLEDKPEVAVTVAMLRYPTCERVSDKSQVSF